MNSKFISVCNTGNLEKCKDMYSKHHITVLGIKNALIRACYKNDINLATWLISLNKIEICNEAFEHACERNNMKIMELLLNSKVVSTDKAVSWLCSNKKYWSKKFIELLKKCIDIDINAINTAFIKACEGGNLDTIQFIMNYIYENNCSIDNAHASFESACIYGKLNVIQWMTTLKIDGTNVIVSTNNELPNYRHCNERKNALFCIVNNLNVLQWLYELYDEKPDIRWEDDIKFRIACGYGNVQMAEWLAQLCKDYIIESIELGMFWINVKFKIICAIKEIVCIEPHDKSILCSICLESNAECMTTCKHQYCKSCIKTWYEQNDKHFCPYCRQTISSIFVFLESI